jgi:hypothetical protein
MRSWGRTAGPPSSSDWLVSYINDPMPSVLCLPTSWPHPIPLPVANLGASPKLATTTVCPLVLMGMKVSLLLHF